LFEEKPVFGRKVAQMQGAKKFEAGSPLRVVRPGINDLANFYATPQMGDFSFKH